MKMFEKLLRSVTVSTIHETYHGNRIDVFPNIGLYDSNSYKIIGRKILETFFKNNDHRTNDANRFENDSIIPENIFILFSNIIRI